MWTLISWNVRNPGPKRLSLQVERLLRYEADCIALQELGASASRRFKEQFADADLNHAGSSFDVASDRERLVGPRRYGQLIASRWPLRMVPAARFRIPWPECVASAVVRTPSGRVELHTAHVPPGISNGVIKQHTLEGIFAALGRGRRLPRILCGDFNTPRAETEDGRTITWGQRFRHDGEVVLSYRGPAWHLAEYAVLRNLADFGLPDVYRLLHGYGPKEFSWYYGSGERRIGRRFDHVFASPLLNPRSCRYFSRASGERVE